MAHVIGPISAAPLMFSGHYFSASENNEKRNFLKMLIYNGKKDLADSCGVGCWNF